MTRWHEDDLCGRILEAEGADWEVIIFRAVREEDDFAYDYRNIGEALWEDRHSLEKIQKVKDKLKKYRGCGLEKEGEYSYENLVFKYLRRNGYIQKLFDFQNNIIDNRLSLSEQK